MAINEIPLMPGTAQRVRVQLGEAFYRLSLAYIEEDEGGWVLDIHDDADLRLICGLPLLPGDDLLEPYAYLGIGVRLGIYTPGDPERRPSFAGLGAETKLLFTVV